MAGGIRAYRNRRYTVYLNLAREVGWPMKCPGQKLTYSRDDAYRLVDCRKSQRHLLYGLLVLFQKNPSSSSRNLAPDCQRQ